MSDNIQKAESYHAPRTWHLNDRMQSFVQSLSEGKVRNRYGAAIQMDKELVNALLSHIDSEELFENIAKEYAAEEALGEGYDVYNLDRANFFAKYRELIEAYTIPSEISDVDGKVKHLYKLIDYYNADKITNDDIKKVFFTNAVPVGAVEEDAWYMGCYAMNNIVLTDILDTYAISAGLVEPEPFVSRPSLERQSFHLISGDDSSALVSIVNEGWTDVEKPLSTRVTVGGKLLLSIKPCDADDFKADLQALAVKYRA